MQQRVWQTYLKLKDCMFIVLVRLKQKMLKNVLDIIRNGRVNFVINTMPNKKNTSADGFLIRRVSAENNISCMTSLDTANALAKV